MTNKQADCSEGDTPDILNKIDANRQTGQDMTKHNRRQMKRQKKYIYILQRCRKTHIDKRGNRKIKNTEKKGKERQIE